MPPRKPRSDAASDALPARITPLAVLPVFLSLRDRKALVIGGSPAAVWKVELLTAAGARVTVIDDPQCWRESDLAGAAIAVADLETGAEAARFASVARRAGVPCNVIDKPAFCSFQFGAIVNRSPVVIGISTAGAAPVLGQAIRRRVEALLPAGLATWAQAAQASRGGLQSLLRSAERRRAFWRAFAEHAFTQAPVGDLRLHLWRLARAATAEPSVVTVVGAGPGDAGLLTLNALRALQSADVILFDAPVSPAVLELARREAKRLPIDGGDDAMALMIGMAKRHRHVVRLVVGDAMTSDRAAQEIAPLRAAGITVAVVPGIAEQPVAAPAASVLRRLA